MRELIPVFEILSLMRRPFASRL